MTKTRLSRSILFLAGILLGGTSMALWNHGVFPTARAMAQEPAGDLASLQTEIAHLKEVVPSQSHSMTDVAFQFENLWFAGKKDNWPLAEFYLNETRSHIRWTIRIRPVRRDANGGPVDLNAIFDRIDKGPLANLIDSIKKKDSAQFVTAYKATIDACYGCHITSGKPFLRPVIPTNPPQSLISYDPK